MKSITIEKRGTLGSVYKNNKYKNIFLLRGAFKKKKGAERVKCCFRCKYRVFLCLYTYNGAVYRTATIKISKFDSIFVFVFQGNRLTVLPPQVGHLDFLNSRSVLKLDNNPWVPPIEDQLVLGVSHVIEYIRTETYRYLYSRHIQASVPPPERSERASKRMARNQSRSSVGSGGRGQQQQQQQN